MYMKSIVYNLGLQRLCKLHYIFTIVTQSPQLNPAQYTVTDMASSSVDSSRTVDPNQSTSLEKDGITLVDFPKRKTDPRVPPETCIVCRKLTPDLKACSKCVWAKYCSTECQRKDYPTHKPTCKTPQERERIRRKKAEEVKASLGGYEMEIYFKSEEEMREDKYIYGFSDSD